MGVSASEHPVFIDEYQNVSGVWSGSVLVKQNLRISLPDTLRIEPGTKVELLPGCQILVEGVLLAIGNSESPIIFMGSGQAKAGDWRSLLFRSSAFHRLNHVTIRHAVKGIDIRGGIIQGSDIQIEDFSEMGIYSINSILNLSKLQIKQNENKAKGETKRFAVVADELSDIYLNQAEIVGVSNGIALRPFSSVEIKNSLLKKNDRALLYWPSAYLQVDSNTVISQNREGVFAYAESQRINGQFRENSLDFYRVDLELLAEHLELADPRSEAQMFKQDENKTGKSDSKWSFRVESKYVAFERTTASGSENYSQYHTPAIIRWIPNEYFEIDLIGAWNSTYSEIESEISESSFRENETSVHQPENLRGLFLFFPGTDQLALLAGFSLPVRKSKLNQDQKVLRDKLGDSELPFVSWNSLEGPGWNVGLSFSQVLGRGIDYALSGGYYYKGRYEPIPDKDERNPSDIWSLNSGVDYRIKNQRFSLDGLLLYSDWELLNGERVYQPPIRFLITISHAFRSHKLNLESQLFYMVEGKERIKGDFNEVIESEYPLHGSRTGLKLKSGYHFHPNFEMIFNPSLNVEFANKYPKQDLSPHLGNHLLMDLSSGMAWSYKKTRIEVLFDYYMGSRGEGFAISGGREVRGFGLSLKIDN